jgi:hypothetical protein
MPGHELLQGFEGAGAVFPGGVGVAADVEAVLRDVVAGRAPVVLGPGTRGTADGPNVTARRNSRGSPG